MNVAILFLGVGVGVRVRGGGEGNEDILHFTLNCAFRWTNTNFSIFHAIQVLIVIIKKMM
jgi:hypothetical protein